MQEQGWGGMAPCNVTEIVPPVYTFGVRFRTPSGRVRTACPKGYALNLDASEILIQATKAFKLLLPRSSGSAMCLYQVAEPSVSPYLAVFVIKSEAVRTFYPDASPTCDRVEPRTEPRITARPGKQPARQRTIVEPGAADENRQPAAGRDVVDHRSDEGVVHREYVAHAGQ